MNKQNNLPDDPKESIFSIIQKLKDGTLPIKNVDNETRLECVDALRLEGCTISQIAQTLKLSDRTIKRYIKELKERNALEADKSFSKEFLGDLMQKISNSFNYLLRLSRNKDTPVADKIQAETSACNLLFDLAKLLQSTGHITLIPQSINADVRHCIANFTEQDIIDIEKAAKESIGIVPALSKVLEGLHTQAAKQPELEQKEDTHETGKTEQ